MQTILGWVEQYGYTGIFGLLTLGIIGMPLPDEGLLAFAGYLAYKGDLGLVPTLAASFLGSVCGITLSYSLGRIAGNYLLRTYGHQVGLTAQRVADVRAWFERLGRWSLTFGYFLPGIRHLTAFAAGMSKLQLTVFAPFTYTGALLWSGAFVLAGYFLGEEWTQVSEKIRPALVVTSMVFGVFLIGYFLVLQGKRR
jgi:membrane protein DedA with SNARE-associated domain